MNFDDYLDQYKRTCVTLEHVVNPMAHSKIAYTFKEDRNLGGTTKPAFFKFFLERDIDLS